jgi:DNA-binding transcriptional MerR regulator
MENIGRLLKEEEQRFIGYSEIESRTTEMGFPVSVRTLRFYVDEGILPPPNKVGKKPVYDQDWILNVLLCIHIMKTRLNRSLREIRAILGLLTENPTNLADKLSLLYEEYVKSNALKPVQRDWLIEAVFDRLTGKSGPPCQPSKVQLMDFVALIEKDGRWRTGSEGPIWEAPDLDALDSNHGAHGIKVKVKRKGSDPEVPSIKAKPKVKAWEAYVKLKQKQAKKRVVKARQIEVEGEVEVVPDVTDPIGPLPEAAVTLLEARSREEFFLSRFEMEFEAMSELLNPVTEKLLPLNQRTCSPLKRDHSANIIQQMKSRHIYDRELLDAIPLERASEYHIYKKGFFGRGELQVVVTGLTLSPVDEFLEFRYGTRPLGPADIQRAISELVIQDGIFYYVGIYSTTGWTKEARFHVPRDKNLLCNLIEKDEKISWRVHGQKDECSGVTRLFDPETDNEKIHRTKKHLRENPKLTLKGGHVVIQNLVEDLELPFVLVRQAVEQLVEDDGELEMTQAAGFEILKRRRF